MRNVILGIFIGIALTIGTVYTKRGAIRYVSEHKIISPIGTILEKPLTKYTILNLSGRKYNGSQIVLEGPSATASAYTVYPFYFTSDTKKVTGLVHIPNGKGPFSVVLQLRGFIEPKNYAPGAGTSHSAEVYAENGFISLAPDFLGFGGSDMPSTDIFEERFETYTTALNLLASIHTLPMADATKVGIWGHSNGGQIALTVLEVIGRKIPTTLWAPVSKPFPYSILYYTDEADDHGKLLRKELAKFEENYDAELYSLTNYFDRITGPIQIHQGISDDAVPLSWSDTLIKSLKDTKTKESATEELNYFTYPGTDHDMNGAWNTVVARDVAFFTKYLK